MAPANALTSKSLKPNSPQPSRPAYSNSRKSVIGFRPELRKNKEIERFSVSVKR